MLNRILIQCQNSYSSHLESHLHSIAFYHRMKFDFVYLLRHICNRLNRRLFLKKMVSIQSICHLCDCYPPISITIAIAIAAAIDTSLSPNGTALCAFAYTNIFKLQSFGVASKRRWSNLCMIFDAHQLDWNIKRGNEHLFSLAHWHKPPCHHTPLCTNCVAVAV